MYCIETKNLTHKFSGQEAVLNNIDLLVPDGSIFGFLGPNGAGKTTTLKLILGLLKKQQGEVSLYGRSFSENRIELLKKVGSLIEVPSLYGHLTAEENLNVFQKIYKCPKTRIKTVLEMVSLSDTGKKKVGKFSLGMKQRLSIAMSILHEPTLLILDEPTNGLDPNGIIEIRELLKKINKENGTTVLVSSHLLSEVEKLVSHVGIINKGSMIFQGTLHELLDQQKRASGLVFETDDPQKAFLILKEIGVEADIHNSKLVIPFVNKQNTALLNEKLVQHNIKVYGISQSKSDLESIFINITTN